ncbi:MAG TPA: DUF309 domain-containing protein [Candidatus Methylomirabilis sp.]|nr:DUF309 domain-containing protein [Candidatus Methylomirabilis sp.]
MQSAAAGPTPGRADMAMDAELLPGIALWNVDEYLLAEEEFERVWLTEVGARRRYLRGLIHAAMGFHYMSLRDISSARSKLTSAGAILAGFAADFLGLDLHGLRAGIAAARAALERAGEDKLFDPAGVPVPRLAPAAAGLVAHEEQT